MVSTQLFETFYKKKTIDKIREKLPTGIPARHHRSINGCFRSETVDTQKWSLD
jgi:hypothetical protein